MDLVTEMGFLYKIDMRNTTLFYSVGMHKPKNISQYYFSGYILNTFCSFISRKYCSSSASKYYDLS